MSITLKTYGAAKKQCARLSSFHGPLNRLERALFTGPERITNKPQLWLDS